MALKFIRMKRVGNIYTNKEHKTNEYKAQMTYELNILTIPGTIGTPDCKANLAMPPLHFNIIVSWPSWQLVSNISAIPPLLIPIALPSDRFVSKLLLFASIQPIMRRKLPTNGTPKMAVAATPCPKNEVHLYHYIYYYKHHYIHNQ